MTLTYLTNQVVYLGSHFGDSQLLQIISTPIPSSDHRTLPIPMAKSKIDETEGIIVNGTGSYLVEIESFNNLAPIVDGILVDTDDSGQVGVVLGWGKTINAFYRMKSLLAPADGTQVR